MKVRPNWGGGETDLKSPFKGHEVQRRGSSCCHHFEGTEVAPREGVPQQTGPFKDLDKISKRQDKIYQVVNNCQVVEPA